MPVAYPPFKPCPCGSGHSYQRCCQPAHLGHPAPTPEALMRSRYAAFALQDMAYVRRTWHPDTRPADLEPGPEKYVGLRIHSAQDDQVEFTARLKLPDGRAARFRERSRFVRLDGAWTYLDGEVKEG